MFRIEKTTTSTWSSSLTGTTTPLGSSTPPKDIYITQFSKRSAMVNRSAPGLSLSSPCCSKIFARTNTTRQFPINRCTENERGGGKTAKLFFFLLSDGEGERESE